MYNSNSNDAHGAMNYYETPFADSPVAKEAPEMNVSSEDFFSNYFKEAESPFSRTYEAPNEGGAVSEAGEAYVNLVAELNNSAFSETLYELASEVEDTWRSKVSDEIAMGENYIPFAIQQSREYFAPLIKETEAMIDRVAQQFGGNNFADQSEAELENYFANLEFAHNNYSPVQEQFFDKVLNKVKSVVKAGVNLAKKGISAVGKLLPIGVVLKKLKGLIKPLLDKVLKFALGKLPKKLQPYARTLAKKFLGVEVSEVDSASFETGNQLEDIQTELDNHIAQLLFAPNDNEADSSITSYEMSFETMERTGNYETGYQQLPSIESARQQFINELKNLQTGENPAPAIERFLPAVILALQPVIKMAITLIGRQKVINFLAGLLAKLVSRYVPQAVAKPLATSIIDVGMAAIGFETYEMNRSDLAYEAIANTIEETIQQMDGLSESSINDSEELSMQLLEAFEHAAADNFPAQYIREELRPSKHHGVWVGMPRGVQAPLYKKFTHVYDITIDPKTALVVKAYRELPLANFLKDKYGLDVSKPVKAKVHLYEVRKGTKLSAIAKLEKLPGLNAKQPKAWIQLLPLTKQAASLLLKEHAIVSDHRKHHTRKKLVASAGQRFYFLEIEGARLRMPAVKRIDHRHDDGHGHAPSTESHSADAQAVINFTRSEIKLNYYFSEEDAKAIVEKLNTNDLLGAAMSIKHSVKEVLHQILTKNVATKVKIIHEALPQLYLENYSHELEEQLSPSDALGKIAGKEILSTIIGKLTALVSEHAYQAILKFFKARAAEFKAAQAEPQDGITIKLTWNNISGMSTIRTIINAIRGDLSLGDISGLSMPSLPQPELKIVADKKFD